MQGGDTVRAEAILTGRSPTFGEVTRAAQAREAARHIIYLVGSERVGVLPTDQAVLMVTLAEDLAAQSEKMTQQADRLAALTAFAARLSTAMASATGSAVRLDVQPAEEDIAVFLLKQARARAAVVDRTRYRHVCQTCGMTTLSNPKYEKLVAHKRKVDAATRGIGVAFLTGGSASPVVMANSLFAFRTQRPDYHCPRCQALETDQSVVVFCPNCKAQYSRPLLKQCAKCHYDFLELVDLSDLWRPLDSVAVPAPAGKKLNELQLDDEPTLLAFLPDGDHMLTASFARSVQMWDIGEEGGTARCVWTAAVGGLVKVSKPIVAVSPDGRWVAIAKPQTPRVRLLRAADGAEVGAIEWALGDGSTPSDLAFWPDSSALIVANAYIETWSLAGRRMYRMKLGAMTFPSRVACSPDGRYIAAAGGSWSNNKLLLWRAADGTLVNKGPVHGAIGDLAWSPDSAALALAVDNTAVLLAMPSGDPLARYPLDAEVTGVASSPDGAYLAAASKDHSARVFDLRLRTEVARISRPGVVTAVAFAPDGRLAVGDDGNAVQFWSPPTAGER
ncbi:hypothetical protein [Nakamurella sp. GG22]